MDPLAMDYPYKSSYDYAENSPILNIDLDGLEALVSHMIPRLAEFADRMQNNFSIVRSSSGRLLSGSSGNTNNVEHVNPISQDMIKVQGVSNDVTATGKAMADVPLETTVLLSEGVQGLGSSLEFIPPTRPVGTIINNSATAVNLSARTLQGESVMSESAIELVTASSFNKGSDLIKKNKEIVEEAKPIYQEVLFYLDKYTEKFIELINTSNED